MARKRSDLVEAISLVRVLSVNGAMEFIPTDPILKFNPNTLEEIRKCWNLDNDRLNQSVDNIEHWLSKQDHIVNKNFSRRFIEGTILQCKGSVEKAKSQIDKLCTLKTLLPKFFIGGDVRKNLGEVADIVFISPLPKLTKDNYRPIVLKLNHNKFTSDTFMCIYQQAVVMCEYLKIHDYVNGFVVIDDLREANLMDVLTKINLVEFQQLLGILIEGYGARIKGIHILHRSKMIELFVNTFKPLLSSKLASRINTHYDLEGLHEVLEKNLLPEDYGGEQKSLKELKDDWMSVLSSEENEKYLAVSKSSITDESRRASGKYNEQIMGLPGSFRTLTVD